MSVAGLRAKVDSRECPFGWEWTIPHHNEEEEPWGGGWRFDLGETIAEANQYVHGILSDRRDGYRKRDLIDAECPECGDPCEYIEGHYPSGGWFTYSCESCGAENGDSF